MRCALWSCRHRSADASGCSLETASAERTLRRELSVEPGLFATSPELARELADRGRATLGARGTCMYPAVRPGDVLRVESRTVGNTAVGDIAVCRRPGYLFAHRVVDKVVENGRPCIITRADRTGHAEDGPTFDDDLLGVVAAIDRRGRRIDPGEQRSSRCIRFFRASELAFIDIWATVRGCLIDRLADFQGSVIYGHAARLWIAARLIECSYVVRVPAVADLYQSLKLEEFDIKPAFGHRAIDRWTLALHLGADGRPAAWASFVRTPSACPHPGWLLEELQARVRYRGAGLERRLLRRAEEVMSRGETALQPGHDTVRKELHSG